MPLRTLYHRSSSGCLELVNPQVSRAPENNVFDKAFDVDMEEWDDWMRWDGRTDLELPSTDLERKHSSASSISNPETWPNNMEISDVPSFEFDEFVQEDAPFELDEPLQPSEDFQAEAHPEHQPSQDLQGSFRGYCTLTAAEEQSLQDIAMPYRMLAEVKLSSEPPSPTLSNSTTSPSPSPEVEPRTRKNNKRKTSMDEDDLPNSLSQSRKRGHNAIEKRYRTNLNEKINCLRQGIPSLSRTPSGDSKSSEDVQESDAEDLDTKTEQQKYGKAAILTRALDYIRHLENNTRRLGQEVVVLQTRVGAFEKLAMSGSIISAGNGNAVPNNVKLIKSETLESIQADFKQIKSMKPKYTPSSTSGIQTRRRGSKNSKINL